MKEYCNPKLVALSLYVERGYSESDSEQDGFEQPGYGGEDNL